MTQKELLYLEDAIGHEKSIITILEQTLNFLDAEKLKSFIESELDEHMHTKEELMNKLEEKANE